jgi:hypothetical protein
MSITVTTAVITLRLESFSGLRTHRAAYYDVIHMNVENTYYQQLSEAIRAKAEELEGSSVRRLRQNIQNFQASISSMYKFWIEKGMLHTDPYKQERTVTQIQIPSSESFQENEFVQDLSQRMSDYISQWDFMVNIFHISLADLNLKTVQRVLELMDYIHWQDFSVNSSYQITRALAGMAARLSSMKDPWTGKMFTSTIGQLGSTSLEIRKELNTITAFLKERYKFQVREKITNGMNMDAEQYRRKPALAMDNIKFEMTHQLKSAGWYRELIHELLEEDFGSDSEKMRTAALSRLKPAGPSGKKKDRTGPDDKTILMGIMDMLAKAGEPIRSTLVKMNENSRTIQERRVSLGERLSRLISSLFHRSEESVMYDIPIRNRSTGSVRYERLNYTSFSASAMKKAVLLDEFRETGSAIRKKVSAADAGKVLVFLEKTLGDVKVIHRNLSGLDEFFLSEAVPEEIRPAMKTSNLNLTNLKSSIADMIKTVASYKSAKEEEEQLRKLGIED